MDGAVTVLGANGQTNSAAFAVPRQSITTESFALLLRQAKDQRDEALHETTVSPSKISDDSLSTQHMDAQIPLDGPMEDYAIIRSTIHMTSHPYMIQLLLWTPDLAPKYLAPGQSVPSWNFEYVSDGGIHAIQYDDGDTGAHSIDAETCRYPDKSVSSASVVELQRNSYADLNSIFENFGNNPFMTYEAQGFAPHLLRNAYESAQERFKNTVSVVPVNLVPMNTEAVSSHTIVKVKVEGEGSHKLK